MDGRESRSLSYFEVLNLSKVGKDTKKSLRVSEGQVGLYPRFEKIGNASKQTAYAYLFLVVRTFLVDRRMQSDAPLNVTCVCCRAAARMTASCMYNCYPQRPAVKLGAQARGSGESLLDRARAGCRRKDAAVRGRCRAPESPTTPPNIGLVGDALN